MVVLYVMSNGTPEENLRQVFRVFDINSDGAISLKELKSVAKVLGKLVDSKDTEDVSKDIFAQAAFNEMDDNGDGLVTEEEFVKACLSHKKCSSMLTLKIVSVFIAE